MLWKMLSLGHALCGTAVIVINRLRPAQKLNKQQATATKTMPTTAIKSIITTTYTQTHTRMWKRTATTEQLKQLSCHI